MSKHGKVKRNLFGKFYALYLIAIVVLLVIVCVNVFFTLVKYEKSQPVNYVLSLVNHAGKSDKSVGTYLQDNFFSENAEFAYGDVKEKSKEFYNTISKSQLEAKKDLLNSSENMLVYNVLADEHPFVTIAIKEVKSVKKMLGLLKIPTYELQYVFLRDSASSKTNLALSEDGYFSSSIVFPADFTLCVDGTPFRGLDQYEETEIADFESISQYSMVPKGRKYKVDLPFEGKLSVLNDAGEEVSISYLGGTYYAAADYSSTENGDAILAQIGDPIAMYKLWARFTRLADVGGAANGLYVVWDECKFLPDSDMYNLAYDWATQIDITFVSDYYGYYFENEKMTNFVQYNDKFCSCDVHVELNVNTYSSGYRTDSFDNRMFFIYNDDTSIAKKGWYWVGQYDITGR